MCKQTIIEPNVNVFPMLFPRMGALADMFPAPLAFNDAAPPPDVSPDVSPDLDEPRPLRIRVDVDGVLADLVGRLAEDAATYGARFTTDDIKHFDFAKSLTPAAMKVVHMLMAKPGWCYDLPWYEGAVGFVRSLFELGAEVLFLTAPYDGSSSWAYERKAWLRQFFPDVKPVSCPSKYKRYFAGDVLIEDNPGTCHDWLEENPDGFALLIDQPWNQPTADEFVHPQHEGLLRVYSYEEAIWLIDHVQHSKEKVRSWFCRPAKAVA